MIKNFNHLTLQEIIHEGVHGNIVLTSPEDWIILEEKLKFEDYISEEEFNSAQEETSECNYNTGYDDGVRDRVKFEREIEELQKLLEENGIEY